MAELKADYAADWAALGGYPAKARELRAEAARFREIANERS
jgi:hypothetical protein